MAKLILKGKPRRGALPGLEAPGRKGGDPPESLKSQAEDPASAPVEMDEEPAGKSDKMAAGFWDHADPKVCSTCKYKSGATCTKVDGVDYENESDADLSSCDFWTQAEGEALGEGEDEDADDPEMV